MQQVGLLLAAAVVAVILTKLRSQAAKERKVVMARLTEERAQLGDYSPTAELFREAGVPLISVDQTLSVDEPLPVETVLPAEAALPVEPALAVEQALPVEPA